MRLNATRVRAGAQEIGLTGGVLDESHGGNVIGKIGRQGMALRYG